MQRPASRDEADGDGDALARLQAEHAELVIRLHEAEETLSAIRKGEVDALIVGEDVYTLDSSNAAANSLRQDVLAQMQDAVLAFDLDDHIIFMNAAAERQYGLPMSAALGRHKSEILQEHRPDGTAPSPVRERLRERNALRENLVHRMPGGEEANVEITASLLRDAAGRNRGVLYVIRDIDDRVRAERSLAATAVRLEQQQRQFSTLVENSPDIFARMDREHRHLYVSPVVTRYTGRPATDFVGRTNQELGMPAELCRLWDEALDEVFAHREVGQLKFAFTDRDGNAAVFHCRMIPELNAAGEIESVLSIAVDVTEQEKVDAALKDSQARLQEADSRKDEFLATLAHELRNPLAPIRNALQMMRLTPAAEVHANARSIIDRQLRQMVHLVDDLLDVSRISRGKMELRREVADITRIVQAAVETSRPLIEAGRHHLAVQLPAPGTLMVQADVTRLCQVVANLLNNAAKYTPEGGRIEVSAAALDDHAVVTVRDNGIGIPPQMLPHIFEMFTQVERGAGRSQGGLGIGLALVRQLLDLHGGDISAHSDGPDRGSTFTMRVPLSHQPAAPAREAPRSHPQPPEDFRVLVVDDNVDSAASMATLLEMLGYRTAIANDGQQALAQADSFRPRVAILDIGLPHLTGHQVAQEIRARPWGGDVLLIALSGWGQEADKEKSRRAGFDRHFAKPVDLAELLKLVATAHDR
ncbi:ATP-binding protein [Ramlibacter sp. PS3R-8]|uniref:PAS domain-containing hybrid sensor histidine kinase/response regulator n=1 Tax=Ramlibacter sp. PS3R-8 TaxID=3133437 RepID=UPI00309F1330